MINIIKRLMSKIFIFLFLNQLIAVEDKEVAQEDREDVGSGSDHLKKE